MTQFGIDRLLAEAELRRERFIESEGEASLLRPTTAGCEALGKLVRARREHIRELIADWPATQREETAALFRRLAEELVPDVRAHPAPQSPMPLAR